MTHFFWFKQDFLLADGDKNAIKSCFERMVIKKAGNIVFTCFLKS